MIGTRGCIHARHDANAAPVRVLNSQPTVALQAPAAAPKGKGKGKGGKKGRKGSGSGDSGAAGGASTVSSGIKLENISITFKNQQVLRGVTWDVKKGERVGLVGALLHRAPVLAVNRHLLARIAPSTA